MTGIVSSYQQSSSYGATARTSSTCSPSEETLPLRNNNRRHAPRNNKNVIAISILAALGVLSLARDVLPSIHSSLRTRSAQQLADTSRASMINMVGSDSEFHPDEMMSNKISHHDKSDSSRNTPTLPFVELKQKNQQQTKTHREHVPIGCEATVLIVRHCEKGHVKEHCAYVGFERSVYLASLFGNNNDSSSTGSSSSQEKWPAPSYIFALAPGGRNRRTKMNFREIETVGPLAQKLNITVNDAYETADTTHLARHVRELLNNGSQMCGKLIVISWKHSEIGHLSRRLGCGPGQGCPLDYAHGQFNFDQVWQIKYAYNVNLHHSVRSSLKLAKQPSWHVFGSVQSQGFDPLAFSKRSGDYGGASVGSNAGSHGSHGAMESSSEVYGMTPRWKHLVADIPERHTRVQGWSSTPKPHYLLSAQQQQQQRHDHDHSP